MIIRKEGVEVGDEIFSVKLYHLIVEIDLRQKLHIGIQV